MNPGIDIGERIRLVFKKTGWSVEIGRASCQYFSDCLAENNKLIRMEKEKKSSPHPVKKKKILLELEITEEEYGHFMNHILKAGQNPGSAQEPDSSNR